MTENVSRRQVLQSLRVSKAYKYIYLNNAKAGCTTIKSSLWQQELLDGRMEEDYNEITVHGVGFWDDFFDVKQREDDFFVFSFVRNPYSRVLSAYLDKITQPNIVRKQFCAFYSLDEAKEYSFADFLEIIDSPLNALEDQHWRPQHLNLLLGKIRIDYIGHLEYFTEDLPKTLQKINVQTSLNAGKMHSVKANQQLLDYYGKKEIELVKNKYKADFEYFNYPEDFPPRLPFKREHSFEVTDRSGFYFIKALGLEKKSKKTAVKFYLKSLEVNPRQYNAFTGLIRLYEALSMVDELNRLIDDVLQKENLPSFVNFLLAQQLNKKKIYDEAEKRVNLAISQDAANAGYYRLKAEISTALGKIDNTLLAIEKASQLQISPIESYLLGAKLLSDASSERNLNYIKKVLTLDPENQEARQMLSAINSVP